MKKHIKALISLVTIALLVFSFFPKIPSVEAETLSDKITDMSDTSLSSIQFVEQKLKIGYNIGNQFDGCIRGESYTKPAETTVEYWETLWTNPVVNEDYIKYLKSVGIQLIRLPVSWYNHIDENNTIDADWLARVKEVVDMIINNDMYCMINIHHDGHSGYSGKKIILDEEHRESTSKYLCDIWTQVGTYFADYGTHLLFEGFNEPTDSSKSMSPNDTRQAEAALQINVFIETIRALGGNNAQRFLVCPGYAGLSFPAYEQLVDTADDKLIATTHSYTPYSSMNTYYPKISIANSCMGYIIDEIGSSGRRPDSDDGALGKSIRETVDTVEGLGTCWWDNGQAGEYALVNRYSATPVNYKTLAGYVGKEVLPVTADVTELINEFTPNYAKFYTEDNNSSGKKYFVVTSQSKITSFSTVNNYQGYYSMNFADNGYVTVYESDDDKTYYKLDTRYINDFSYAKWKFCSLLGSTELTYWVEGNYQIDDTLVQPCKVNLDGEQIALVKKGAKYILPSSEKAGFICYTDGESFYDAGQVITVSSDLSLTTLCLNLKMVKGAAMRINEKTGIRFYTSVDKSQLDVLKGYGATLEKGTLIAHSSNLGNS
ncbi:MAG: glycoside hydrolase family 5 protein, partial [Acutalibacteraceae bacterium]